MITNLIVDTVENSESELTDVTIAIPAFKFMLELLKESSEIRIGKTLTAHSIKKKDTLTLVVKLGDDILFNERITELTDDPIDEQHCLGALLSKFFVHYVSISLSLISKQNDRIFK